MDKDSRQKALDNPSLEDLEKIKAHQASTEGALKVDAEWLLLAEFAERFGWQAYLDAKDDRITMQEMLTLIEAGRKLDYRKMLTNAQTSFIGSVSSQAKKPASTFQKLVKTIIKKTKADES